MSLTTQNTDLIAFKKLSGKVHTQQTFGVAEEGISSNIQSAYATIFGNPIVALPATTSGLTSLYSSNNIVERVKFQIDIIADTQIGANRSQGYRLKLPSDYNASGKLFPQFSAGTYLHTSQGKLQIIPPSFGKLKSDGTTEYDPILYQTNGSTIISRYDPINWYFDPYSGILFVQDPPAGYDISASRPGYLEAFLYVGQYLDKIFLNNTTNFKSIATYASTGNVTPLSGNATIDGFAVVTGDIILLKNQATGIENGTYVANTAGAWSRTSDLAAGTTINKIMIFVQKGNTQGNTFWSTTNTTPAVIGSSTLGFLLGGYNGVNGLTRTGGNIGLGGTLTGNTTINGGGKNLNIGTGGSSIKQMNFVATGSSDIQFGSDAYIHDSDGLSSVYISNTSGIELNRSGFGLNKVYINDSYGFRAQVNNVNNSLALVNTTTQFNIAYSASTIGSGVSNYRGLEYLGDYSTHYSSRSLVDKAYADNIASTSGWRVAGTTILTSGALINLGNNTLQFNSFSGGSGGFYTTTYGGGIGFTEHGGGIYFNEVTTGGLHFQSHGGSTRFDEYAGGGISYFDHGQGGMNFNSDGGGFFFSDTLNGGFYVDAGSTSVPSASAQIGLTAKSNPGVSRFTSLYVTPDSAYVQSNLATFAGFTYDVDYSANFTPRSLVDKAYVTGLTSGGGSVTANNGLKKSGANILLGGALTGATTIGLGVNSLTFTGTTGTLKYGTNLSGNYTPRSLVDKGYVTGNTLTGVTTPFIYDTQTAVPNVFSYKTNTDILGQGTITLTNGSSSIVGNGTNFLDATTGRGLSYWFALWVKDSANNWYYVFLSSIANNIGATMSSNYSRAQIRNGYNFNTATFQGVTGTYKYYIGSRNWSDGLFSLALGNNSYADNFSTAIGSSAVATGQTAFAAGFSAFAGGQSSTALGSLVRATGAQSFAGGKGNSQIFGRSVLASGLVSFNYSESNSSQTAGHGALAANSVILGGINHNIPSNSNRSAIIGGNTIKATSATTDTVFMPKVRIGQGTGGSVVTNNLGTNLIGRNISTGELENMVLTGTTTISNMILSGTTTPFVLDNQATVQNVFAYRTNVDIKGPGKIIMTNGSSIVSGISTTFTDATTGRGLSYWFRFWVKDSAGNWYHNEINSVTNATRLVMDKSHSRAQIRLGTMNQSGNASIPVVSPNFSGVTGTYDYWITRSWTDGLYSVSMGGNSYADNFSFAFGGNAAALGTASVAIGQQTFANGANGISIGTQTRATGSGSAAIGYRNEATGSFANALGTSTISSGNGSFTGGRGFDIGGSASDKFILASGAGAINISENTTSQTAGHGALAADSGIFAGINHNVPSNSSRSVVIGGNAIKATSATTDTVFMPRVRIGRGTGGALVTGSSTNILTRNTSTGEIEVRLESSLIPNITANNGLTKSGNNIYLGGLMTGQTVISQGGADFILSGGTIFLDGQGAYFKSSNGGGVYLQSDLGGGIFLQESGGGGINIGDNTLNDGGITVISKGVGSFITQQALDDTGIAQKATLDIGTFYSGVTMGAGNQTFDFKNEYNNSIFNVSIDATSGTSSIELRPYSFSLNSFRGSNVGYVDYQLNSKILQITSESPLAGAKLLLSAERLGAMSKIEFGTTPHSFLITDSRTGTTASGIEYAADYSTNYTSRSLVDKNYVDTNFAGAITANNGITKSGNNNIFLGGILTGDTWIDTSFAGKRNFRIGRGQVFGGNTDNMMFGADHFMSNSLGGSNGWNFLAGESNFVINTGTTTSHRINNSILLGLNNQIRNGVNNNIFSATHLGGALNTIDALSLGAGNAIAAAFTMGYNSKVTADMGYALGYNALAAGKGSLAFGWANTYTFGSHTGTVQRVLASGAHSINMSSNSTGQTSGHGALADYSVILGGNNHNIPSNSTRSVIIGGNAIKATSATTDTVFLPKVRIGYGLGAALVTGTSTNFVTRNITTGELEVRLVSSITGTTNAVNGLVKKGTNIGLGGTLTGNTTINTTTGLTLTFNAQTQGTPFISGQIGSNANVGLLSFKNKTTNSLSSGLLDINIGSGNGSGSIGAGNISVGSYNLRSVISGATEFNGGRNIAIGYDNQTGMTIGTHNINIGRKNSLVKSGNPSYGIGIGYETGINSVATANDQYIALGVWTMRNFTGTTGSINNVAIGASAMEYSIGNASDSTVAIGPNALSYASFGDGNIALGTYAGWSSKIANGNILIGNSAGITMTGSSQFSIGIGVLALQGGDGYKNVFVGTEAGSLLVRGSYNSGFGTWSLPRTIGNSNTGLGAFAGFHSTLNLTGSSNTFIGWNASYGAASMNNSIVIGTNFNPTGSSKVYLGSTQQTILGSVLSGTTTNILVKETSGEIKYRDITDINNTVKGIIITTTATGSSSLGYVGVSASTAMSFYLPASPKSFQRIMISDIKGNAFSTNITINGNGKNINGSSTALINTNYGSIMLIYNGFNWSGGGLI